MTHVMNAETKLALVLLALMAFGVSLIAYGAGVLTSKLGAVVTGVAIVWVAAALMRILWRP